MQINNDWHKTRSIFQVKKEAILKALPKRRLNKETKAFRINIQLSLSYKNGLIYLNYSTNSH